MRLKDRILQLLWTGSVRVRACSHEGQIAGVEPNSMACEQCIASGDVWVGLRMCAICGETGCCDTSKNRHARKHFEETGHPIIYSDPLAKAWTWCYVDRTLLDGRPQH